MDYITIHLAAKADTLSLPRPPRRRFVPGKDFGPCAVLFVGLCAIYVLTCLALRVFGVV